MTTWPVEPFTVFDMASGEIVRSGVCQVGTLELQASGPDEGVLAGEFSARTHYIVNGEAAPYEPGVAAVKATVPGHPARWSNDSMSWVDTRTLAEVKAAKNAQINAARLAANRSTFTFQGKQIACDELSRSDIDGANGIITLTGALPDGWPGGWKTVDNDYVAIPSVVVWTQFYAAMVAQGTANFTKAQTLKAQVAAATTAAEVDAITW